jgi:hypothetical protein
MLLHRNASKFNGLFNTVAHMLVVNATGRSYQVSVGQ